MECFLAEQSLVGVATGCAWRERTIPIVSGLACCLARALDQIRLAAASQTNMTFSGSHCGVSHKALEDLSMFSSIPGSIVFYPSDAVSTQRAVELAANIRGICFIRITSRSSVPVIYSNEEPFAVGKAKVGYFFSASWLVQKMLLIQLTGMWKE